MHPTAAKDNKRRTKPQKAGKGDAEVSTIELRSFWETQVPSQRWQKDKRTKKNHHTKLFKYFIRVRSFTDKKVLAVAEAERWFGTVRTERVACGETVAMRLFNIL